MTNPWPPRAQGAEASPEGAGDHLLQRGLGAADVAGAFGNGGTVLVPAFNIGRLHLSSSERTLGGVLQRSTSLLECDAGEQV